MTLNWINNNLASDLLRQIKITLFQKNHFSIVNNSQNQPSTAVTYKLNIASQAFFSEKIESIKVIFMDTKKLKGKLEIQSLSQSSPKHPVVVQ